ncbi:MAG: hypothetical protein QM528_03100 [Phycisphaerales bacterium]|nr:hypothetical protein [Phycisphaerales bacterium]
MSRQNNGFIPVIISFLILILIGLGKCGVCGNDQSHSVPDKKTANGDLDNSFSVRDSQPPMLSPEQKIQILKDSLIENGWKENDINNGALSPCYNYQPERSDIDNYLEVKVGGETDVVIKVINVETEKCIRYVYVNSGTTYQIKNIPEGRYYLKIAYGKDWISKVIDGKCIGKFIRNPFYKKGDNILDFNVEHIPTPRGEHVKTPSFSLSLSVKYGHGNDSNTFNSEGISENQFNN